MPKRRISDINRNYLSKIKKDKVYREGISDIEIGRMECLKHYPKYYYRKCKSYIWLVPAFDGLGLDQVVCISKAYLEEHEQTQYIRG